ncbi:GNAT family N-acetyltransferase [Vibrio nigripulchritudo]|uniref:GNAT family N-acetyltransferase n=1 Tax=Vibrio nigripulchritudo TaxID=28173 RepID=UPI00138E444A|nr:GNAT family N-acetyltransferase [Vibrio nigripulchritudo]
MKELLPLGYRNIEQLSLDDTDNEIPKIKLDILKKRLLFDDVTDYIFLENDKVVGHYGLAFENRKSNRYINAGLNIEPSVTYLFDDYTKSAYRGCGYHKKSIKGRLAISKAKGYKSSIVLIYKNNILSISSYEKLGFVKKRSVYEIKFFGKKIMIGTK